ncbi:MULTISPECIES: 3D domain-containing protein [Clostridia]|jgi:3D (Asp-Asp-Asp) domain-containing protein/peptidoglycan hydrolase CwlO-like protein|nr:MULTISPECIES: 3D domain-containing protein [Clostridiaceae]
MFLFKKITSCVLAMTILLSSLGTIKTYATTPQDTINENLSKYKQLDSEILDLDAKIEELNTEIATINSKLTENKESINSIESQIQSTESKLEQTKEEIEQAQITLDNRVRNMYKTNISSNMIVSIITSTSISDLFSRIQAISKIISTDKKILININEKKDSLNKDIESLNTKKSELKTLQATIENDLKVVEQKKQEQEEYSDKLNAEKEAVFAVIEENEKTLISKPLSIANSSTASVSELQNAIDTLNSYIPLLNSSTTINLAKEGISNAKARISELNTPTVPTTSTEVGTAIKTLTMESTAYYGHGITASGLKPVRNPDGISTIAVDPDVIPLGTKVYVSGYGLAIAADTGGAIKGNIIDVFLNTHEECISWGRRQVTVQILEYP